MRSSAPVFVQTRQTVEKLYTYPNRLISLHHRLPQKSAIGMVWHGHCIVKSVPPRAFQRYRVAGRLLPWSRTDPPSPGNSHTTMQQSGKRRRKPKPFPNGHPDRGAALFALPAQQAGLRVGLGRSGFPGATRV